jgi:ABC-type nitrate/sulfonate/bicarbonate transport system substrate-binding protein
MNLVRELTELAANIPEVTEFAERAQRVQRLLKPHLLDLAEKKGSDFASMAHAAIDANRPAFKYHQEDFVKRGGSLIDSAGRPSPASDFQQARDRIAKEVRMMKKRRMFPQTGIPGKLWLGESRGWARNY